MELMDRVLSYLCFHLCFFFSYNKKCNCCLNLYECLKIKLLLKKIIFTIAISIFFYILSISMTCNIFGYTLF